jgi:hypothetical protein
LGQVGVEELLQRKNIHSIMEEEGMRGGQDSKFLQGQIKRITLSDIKSSLLLVEARLTCSEFIMTSDRALLIKYLSEMRYYELSIDLALASNLSAAYPVALMYKEYHDLIG